ncbi:MAG: hypothetical protein CVU91_07920 [Firmicutes bacterium HGW-Firmicutes-16]|nr:MAG: hypothetical protein CVU91_07920 [Firmicutes bacterium HGW-Firmicutes-16]
MNVLEVKKKLFSKKTKREKSELVTDATVTAKKKKTRKRVIIIIVIAAVLLLLFLGLRSCGTATGNMSGTATTYSAAQVEKQDITVKLSGSGTLQAADSYEVTSLTAGEILSADFKEGDIVEKDAILYQIDTNDAETSIKSAELSLQRSQLSYNNILKTIANLSVKAPAAGTITEINVKVGDTVQTGSKIGTVRNSASVTLRVPFNSTDVDSFYVGESAAVTLDSTFETLNGTVTKINNTEQVLTGNMLVKYVTIEVTNPGGITDLTSATATIDGLACNSSAAFDYISSETITAKASGTVSSIIASEGDHVEKNSVVVNLTSDDIDENVASAKLSLEDAQNNLENKQEALEDYTIRSPIAGTIITKTYKAGDKLDSTSAKTALCKIYDLSYLTMELSVDELDISKVSVGQKVSITADAVEGKTFTGEVTKVNISGTTTNGVTAYPVTVKIPDTEDLLPGMNVSAEIVVKSVKNVLAVPVDAISRGNKILVCKDASKLQTAAGESLATDKSGIPVGFEYVQVTLGVNNDEYIEVTSGLKEGDTIAVLHIIDTISDMYQQMSQGEQGGSPPEGEGGQGRGPSGG